MTSGADHQPPREKPKSPPRPRPRPEAAASTAPAATRSRPSAPRKPRKPRPDRAPRPAATPEPEATPPPPRSGSPRWAIVTLSALTAVVVGLVVYAVLGSGSSDGGGPSVHILPPANPSTTVAAEQLATFTDAETGFSLKYPKSWQPVGSPVRDLRLALDAGGGAGLSVRVVRTEQPTTPDNIANLEAFTQAAVNLNPSAKIVTKEQTTVNGMPAFYYLYTFRDDETGQEGVHAHYFAFQGRKMNVLVFQVLAADPQAEFERLAPTFDQVTASFRSDPDVAPSTTVPAVTTTSTAG